MLPPLFGSFLAENEVVEVGFESAEAVVDVEELDVPSFVDEGREEGRRDGVSDRREGIALVVGGVTRPVDEKEPAEKRQAPPNLSPLVEAHGDAPGLVVLAFSCRRK